MKNLIYALKYAGSSFDSILKTTILLTVHIYYNNMNRIWQILQQLTPFMEVILRKVSIQHVFVMRLKVYRKIVLSKFKLLPYDKADSKDHSLRKGLSWINRLNDRCLFIIYLI